ncbi:Conserved_hypothetical protein [Hexamita inflata]|uniref:CBM21 domain-containing protein n=1 Tax=Hexamita inflata TaxID=28002 RepID=A0AA86UXK1_9EUKA|nr:Conserved hypothetical protein [Hexamita inflata]
MSISLIQHGNYVLENYHGIYTQEVYIDIKITGQRYNKTVFVNFNIEYDGSISSQIQQAIYVRNEQDYEVWSCKVVFTVSNDFFIEYSLYFTDHNNGITYYDENNNHFYKQYHDIFVFLVLKSLMIFVNENNDRILSGVIKVANLGFEKQVIIHSTFDNWKTKEATHATHIVNNDFKFNIVLDSIAHKIQFVIQFICAGQEYWDNNSGKNYSLFIGPRVQLNNGIDIGGYCRLSLNDQNFNNYIVQPQIQLLHGDSTLELSQCNYEIARNNMQKSIDIYLDGTQLGNIIILQYEYTDELGYTMKVEKQLTNYNKLKLELPKRKWSHIKFGRLWPQSLKYHEGQLLVPNNESDQICKCYRIDLELGNNSEHQNHQPYINTLEFNFAEIKNIMQPHNYFNDQITGNVVDLAVSFDGVFEYFLLHTNAMNVVKILANNKAFYFQIPLQNTVCILSDPKHSNIVHIGIMYDQYFNDTSYLSGLHTFSFDGTELHYVEQYFASVFQQNEYKYWRLGQFYKGELYFVSGSFIYKVNDAEEVEKIMQCDDYPSQFSINELFVAVSMSKGLCVYLKSDQSLYGVHKSETLKKDWQIVQQGVFGSVVSSLYLTEDNYLYVGDFGNAMLHCLRIQLTFELLNQYAVSVHKRRSNQIYAKQQQTHQNFKIQMSKINDSVSKHSSQLQIVANMFSQTMDGAYQ